MKELQLDKLNKQIDKLQSVYGSPNLKSVYGTGCIKNPRALFLFMNPTGKNISSDPKWQGIRATWLGTKNIWKLFYLVKIINKEIFDQIQKKKASEWTNEFALKAYENIASNLIYSTNLAKCTQDDARPLNNNIFKAYLENTLEEIYKINPKKIISFGNQVSSILLGKNIKVSDYDDEKETLIIKDKEFEVYPVYYPIGQGMRNMGKAVRRINKIIN